MSLVGARDVDAAPVAAALGAVPAVCQTTTEAAAATCPLHGASIFPSCASDDNPMRTDACSSINHCFDRGLSYIQIRPIFWDSSDSTRVNAKELRPSILASSRHSMTAEPSSCLDSEATRVSTTSFRSPQYSGRNLAPGPKRTVAVTTCPRNRPNQRSKLS